MFHRDGGIFWFWSGLVGVLGSEYTVFLFVVETFVFEEALFYFAVVADAVASQFRLGAQTIRNPLLHSYLGVLVLDNALLGAGR